MIPVFQTITVGLTKAEVAASDWPNFGVGNCFQAAVASLFEVPLDAVPHFTAYQDWQGLFQCWLATRGLTYITIHGETPDGVPCLATGPSPRGDYNHVVIWQDGRCVHDPHPSGDGLAGDPIEFDLLTPINPARFDGKSDPQDGARVVFMGDKHDSGNGGVGRVRMVIEWEDGAIDPFNGFTVDQYIESTQTWIVSR